jgi:hypothetical protein
MIQRRLTAVVTTAAATVMAATLATGGAAGAQTAGAAAQHHPHTRVHVHLTGCDRCSVQLQQAVSGAPSVWTSDAQRVGADHEATFRVLSSHTHGLSFVLRAPWEGDTGAVPNIVTRYSGHHVDSFVRRAGARRGTHAEGCWAGTNLPSVDLDFHVARIPGKTLTGHKTQIPLAYATHSMLSWRPMVKTFKGTIANQDAFYCTKPPTTKVTFKAANCTGCEFQVMDGAIRPENIWGVPTQKMTSSGEVTFRVPRPLTRGLSATVSAPWEGHPDYLAVVAWRYAGHQVGDSVGFRDARSRSHGSACWGGTSSDQLVVPLTVRKVMVPAYDGPTAGTIAFAKVTQTWVPPMMDARKGVLGSQEEIICQR